MGWIRKVFDKVDISRIISKHLDTFYNYAVYKQTGEKVATKGERFIFIFLPLAVAVILYVIGVRFSETYIDLIITSLSIFIGLLFGLLVLVFEIASKEKVNVLREDNYKIEAKYQLSKELFVNIAFAILLSIFAIITLFISQLRSDTIIDFLSKYWPIYYFELAYSFIFNILGFFLVLQFVLTLLMILKRFFIIYLTEFGEGS